MYIKCKLWPAFWLFEVNVEVFASKYIIPSPSKNITVCTQMYALYPHAVNTNRSINVPFHLSWNIFCYHTTRLVMPMWSCNCDIGFIFVVWYSIYPARFETENLLLTWKNLSLHAQAGYQLGRVCSSMRQINCLKSCCIWSAFFN
jgi:hypothetical protein